MQIGLMGPFASWAAMLIRPSQRILLVAETANCAQEAHNRLTRVGFAHVAGYVLADKQQWRERGLDAIGLPTYVGKNACLAFRANPAAQLIDVRSRAEWLRGHLPGAISMPLLGLTEQSMSINPCKPILVYCQDEYRATIAASILLRDHTLDIGILTGDVQEWQICNMLSKETRDENIDPIRTRRAS